MGKLVEAPFSSLFDPHGGQLGLEPLSGWDSGDMGRAALAVSPVLPVTAREAHSSSGPT